MHKLHFSLNIPLYFLILFLLFSCSREEPADVKTQEIPETRSERLSEELKTKTLSENELYIEITPTDASRTSTIKLIPEGFKLDDAKVEWFVNGNIDRDSTSSTFNANRTLKGDNVQARVTVNNTALYSNIIYIKNAPPELTLIELIPDIFKPGDTLGVHAEASDPDGDNVTIFYEWTKNGEPAGNSSHIEGTLKRGDRFSIKITPFDGEEYGQSITFNREIKNMPPIIIDDKRFNFDGKVFTYQVKASDPDDDPLTFSLVSSPEGMEIDSSTGLIKWDVPPDFTGKTQITVSVADDHGGEAIQTFNVEIATEQK